MDRRFKRYWDKWHALKQEGKTPADFLSTASDETLVELLAYSAEGSDIDRNIIATELTNRLSRLHRNVASHGEQMDELVDINKGHLAEADLADDQIREQTREFRDETEKTSRHSKTREEQDDGW